jgi:predicted HicB family RNase H-like nuclease
MTEDNRVDIELDLNEHEVYLLAMEAHKRDITLNKMIESILQEVVDKYKDNEPLV